MNIGKRDKKRHLNSVGNNTGRTQVISRGSITAGFKTPSINNNEAA